MNAIQVLHVEDDPDVAAVVSTALGRSGMRVRLARSAKEAEVLLGRESFDAAVIDRHIGADDGLVLIERIRDRHPDLGILLLSGSITPEVADRAYALGVTRCLDKPCRLAPLVEYVRLAAGRSGRISFAGAAEKADRAVGDD